MFKKGQPVKIPFCNKEGVVEYESQVGNSYLIGVMLLKAKGIAIPPTLYGKILKPPTNNLYVFQRVAHVG